MIRLIILRIFESYFRHRWLNLVPILIMSLVAGAFLNFSKSEYVARGTVYIQKSSLLSSLTNIQEDGFAWTSPTQVALNEINELLQTNAFIRSAIQKTDLEARMSEGPETVATIMAVFRQSVQIQLVGDNLIEFSAKTDNPKLSQQLAAATIDAYTQWKLNGDQQESAVALSFFAEVIPPYQQALEKARDDMKNFLKDHPTPLRGERDPQEQAQIAEFQAAIDLASKRLENALDKQESAKFAQSQAESNVHQNYLVIDSPTVPLKPEQSLKTMALSASIFVVVGVLMSLVSIAGGALLDRSFRFTLDVRNALDLPVLAIISDITRLPAATLELQAELATGTAASQPPEQAMRTAEPEPKTAGPVLG